MRYHQINDYYIEDKFTGRKITLTQACRLLNKYDENLLDETIKRINLEHEGDTLRDKNGTLWRFHNGRWQASCSVIPIKKER